MGELEAQLTRFRAYLTDHGLRLTTQRRAIAEVFFDGDKHLSLTEILDLAKERRGSIGYATVYRTMRLLTEGGFAVEHKFGESHTRFEPAVDGEHHDHFICVECGRVAEFEDAVIEQRQAEVAAQFGFDVVSHKHEIYVSCVGTCDNPTVQAKSTH